MFLAATIVAGCGGGSTSAPVPAVSASPGNSITSLVGVPGTAATVSLPAVSGITPAFGVSAGAPAGLTMSVTESTTAPTTSDVVRKTASGTSITPFLYISVTFSANVNAGIVASEMLTLSSSLPTNVGYYCLITDSTTTATIGTYGPVVPVDGSVTIPNGTSGPSFSAGQTYLFAFYYQTLPSPTPSPTGSGGASPTPTPTGGASPTPTPTGGASPTPTPVPTATATVAGSATAPPLFTLSGASASTASVTPPTAPGPVTVPASGSPGYGTYGAHLTLQFGAATSSAAYSMNVSLGSTSADISPSGAFPFYTGSAATPLFYFELTPSTTVTFTQTPSGTVTVTNGFGSSNTCSLFVYENSGGSTYQWMQISSTLTNVSGNSVTIPAAAPPPGLSVELTPTAANLAFIGC